MTYPWKAQIVLVGGNILLIKIKCSATQYLEIMIFRCLKTLVLTNLLKIPTFDVFIFEEYC